MIIHDLIEGLIFNESKFGFRYPSFPSRFLLTGC